MEKINDLNYKVQTLLNNCEVLIICNYEIRLHAKIIVNIIDNFGLIQFK